MINQKFHFRESWSYSTELCNSYCCSGELTAFESMLSREIYIRQKKRKVKKAVGIDVTDNLNRVFYYSLFIVDAAVS